MNNSKKCTAILAALGSTLILHSSPAMAISNTNNEGGKVETSVDKLTIEKQFNDVLATTTSSAVTVLTTPSAVTVVTTSSAVALVDLQNKINSAVAKVEQDKNAGLVFATEKLSDLYLEAAKVDGTLPYFQSTIDVAKKMIQAGSVDEVAIKAASDAIDTAYNTLRTIKTYDSFSGTDGEVWKDTNGVPIQAHGGQVQKMGGKWWWYGEDKTKGYRSNGISAYSSDDLYNWNFEGYVMRTINNREQLNTDPYFSKLYKDYTEAEKDNVYLCFNDSNAVIERPKMIYNEKTKKYVLWFHDDGPTLASPNSNYAAAAAGVAISDSPNGPFKFLGRYRLNVCPEADKKGEWYETSAGFARDMNLWIDDDGTAYIIYSSEENRTMFISKLNDDYTYLSTDVDQAVKGKDFVRLFPGAQREAPALFKYNGKYYMITSNATGWDPNQAKYWTADSVLGEWTDMGDPCINDKDKKTFYTQSTNVIPVDKDSGKFIYMGDRWKSSNLEDSRYVWLPLEFDSKGKLLIKPYTNWKLKELNNKYSVQLNSELKDVYTNVADLPKVLSIKVYENGQLVDKDTKVTWNIPEITPMVQTNITGVLDGINREINTTIINIPNNLKYYIDCGDTKSKTFDLANNKVTLKNNDVSDKAYTAGSWGYSSKIGTDIDLYATTSTDPFETGYWAHSGKTIDYVVPLEAGSYNLYAGFKEWWNTSRTTAISISYKNKKGDVIKQTLGSFTNNGQKTIGYNFELAEDADVTVSVYKPNSTNPDVILSWLAVEFDSVKVAKEDNPNMKDIYAGTDELPQTLNIKAFENNVWVNKNTTVTWNIPTLTPLEQTTVTGTLGYNGKKINANVLNVPKNLQYYVDCGAKNSSTIYDLLNKKIQLKNNQGWDQAYTKGSWGYEGKIDTDIGYKNNDSSDAYSSGFWAYKDKKIEYAVPLKAGDYNLFAGFNEWWSTNRTTGISISYKNSSGEVVKQELGTFTNNGKKKVNYTFNLPEDDEVILSVYKPNVSNPDVILSWFAIEEIIQEHAINVEVGEHGSISPNGTINVVPNQDGEFTITPDSGYEISDVKVDGVSVGAVGSYTFKGVTKAHTINATFKVKENPPISNSFPIKVEAGEHGSISPNGTINVVENQDKTFTVTPDSGYEINDVKVDGVSVGAVSNYSFKAVTKAHTINATFKVKENPPSNSFSINVEAGEHGSISPNGTINVVENQDKAFTIAPDDGYEISDVKVDGVSVGAVSSYTLKNVTNVHTISATFKVKDNPSSNSFSIKVEAGEHGDISPNGTINVVENQDKAFTITPDSGYEISDVKVDGVSVGAISSYSFKAVTKAHTINATFKVKENPSINSFSINVETGEHGNISPNGIVNVVKNQDREFTITPDSGYEISDVKIDGVSVGAVSSYTLKNVTKAHTISATFSLNVTNTSSRKRKGHDVSDKVTTNTDEASIISAINSATAKTIVIDMNNSNSTNNTSANAGTTGNTPLISENVLKGLKTNVDKTLVIKAADSSIEIKSINGKIQFTENGAAVIGFKLVDQAEYYLNESGIMQMGWVQTQDKNWYHLNLDTGIKDRNWFKEINGNWYYLDNKLGNMKTGWLNDNGTWYYLNNDGVMKTGWLNDSDGKWYYLDTNGAMVSNTKIDGYELGKSGALI